MARAAALWRCCIQRCMRLALTTLYYSVQAPSNATHPLPPPALASMARAGPPPASLSPRGPSLHPWPCPACIAMSCLYRAPPLPHRGVVGRAEEHLVGPRAHARHAVRMSAQLALAPLLLPHPPATAPSPTRPALLSNVDAAQLSLFDQAVVGSGVEMLPDQTQTEYGRRMATKDRRATRLGRCFIPHAHCRIS